MTSGVTYVANVTTLDYNLYKNADLSSDYERLNILNLYPTAGY